MPTQEAIDRLKSNWANDPHWDIEDTEGFEEHHDELLKYRLAMEAQWAANEQARREKDPAYQARASLSLAYEASENGWPESQNYHLRVAQVQAILALVDRIDKITDRRYSPAIRTLNFKPGSY